MADNGFDDIVRDPKHPQKTSVLETVKPLQESRTQRENVAFTPQGSDVTAKARDLTSRALEFLSNASNETLGACVLALGATTWLILGRIGLVLIGIVAGVVLHATWEGSSQGNADAEASAREARRRREKGLDVVARVLDWREKTKDDKNSGSATSDPKKALDFTGFQPETGAALAGLTDAVIRDYVK